jgi:ethanolamine ammonia-lyase large subunit
MSRTPGGHSFASLAEVMAKANEEKSGDQLAGLAAADAEERVAARTALADVRLDRFVEEPLLPPEDDELTREFLDALDTETYRRIAGWTVGELREHLLADPPASLASLRPGVVPEMAAAAAKLMSNDLLLAAERSCRSSCPDAPRSVSADAWPRASSRTTRATASTASWQARSRGCRTAAGMRSSE